MISCSRPRRVLVRTRALVVVVALCAVLVAGCGNSVSGKYEGVGEAAGHASIDFKSNNKADVDFVGMKVEADYKVEGDKVTVTSGNGGNMVFTIEKDGTLKGPEGLNLKKKA